MGASLTSKDSALASLVRANGAKRKLQETMGENGVGITRKRSLERFLAKFSGLPEGLCRLCFTARCFLLELCSVAIFERDELLREPSRKIQREFVEP